MRSVPLGERIVVLIVSILLEDGSSLRWKGSDWKGEVAACLNAKRAMARFMIGRCIVAYGDCKRLRYSQLHRKTF